MFPTGLWNLKGSCWLEGFMSNCVPFVASQMVSLNQFLSSLKATPDGDLNSVNSSSSRAEESPICFNFCCWRGKKGYITQFLCFILLVSGHFVVVEILCYYLCQVFWQILQYLTSLHPLTHTHTLTHMKNTSTLFFIVIYLKCRVKERERQRDLPSKKLDLPSKTFSPKSCRLELSQPKTRSQELYLFLPMGDRS